LHNLKADLHRVGPSRNVESLSLLTKSLGRDLDRLLAHFLAMQRQRWKEAAGCLESLSPLDVLSRGYSITRLLPSGRILRNVEGVREGDALGILLSRGCMECRVEKVEPDGADYFFVKEEKDE
jgi:exodeoxyribonuclease VII large subunit